MSYGAKAEKHRLLIETALEGYMNSCSAPDLLKEAMAYSLNAGGKRLRPCLVLEVCEMLGGKAEDALPFACALEMIHTYSLIHDDLPCMDDDDFRRGKPSNHKVFGEANAVLAGDGLLSYAFEIMCDALENNFTRAGIRAAKAVAKGAGVSGMVAGQVIDLAAEGQSSADEDTIRFIQANKTAAMIKAALLAGANAANASWEELKALEAFGEAYGALFQMTDDILDIEGSFESMGKTIGKDANKSKMTYPALIGLQAAKHKARQTADEAIAALEIFGDKAEYLRELTLLTVDRRS